eukprot:CAMPEP_0116561158 /NCGR_PEP_ID=MMETSP0397-20121206/11417_1 /TAXON_ID=216820 /ORGANISM="Cyclophora tenuis, Strain ECT3854" /LENGTH=180 /DNA_ID=CAMNT_0004087249 /DNA_START=47 /DNA_END=589 /DNA_ORIENTATION=-
MMMKMMMMMKVAAFLVIACGSASVGAFAPPQALGSTTTTTTTRSSLCMAPRFDKSTQKWVPSSEAETESAGYNIWGTLLRGGPKPFFSRLFSNEGYQQGVLKLMAGDKISYIQAQASMDAYLENPNDWAYDRYNNPGRDYVTLDTKAITLRLIWASIVFAAIGRAAYSYTNDVKFYDFLS